MGSQEVALTLQQTAQASKRLRLAVIGLDFRMFNASRAALALKTERFSFEPKWRVFSRWDSSSASFL